MERKVFATAVALLVALTPVAALAKAKSAAQQGEKRACASVYRHAQERAKSSHLREAKELLLKCAKPTCGSFLLQACTARYTQLEADIPSVVPLVTDNSGAELTSVEVTMDGHPLTSKLDGRALPVDPGKHEFAFSKDGDVFATENIMILAGQRNRAISVSTNGSTNRSTPETKASLKAQPVIVAQAAEPAERNDQEEPAIKKASARKTAPEPKVSPPKTKEQTAPEPKDEPREERASSGTSAFAYVFGLTGLIGVGGYGVLTYWGRKDNSLLADCSPNCKQSSVDHVRLLYLAADVSLGVGLVSLVASTWLFASSGSEKTTDAGELALFSVFPTRNGAVAAIGGAF